MLGSLSLLAAGEPLFSQQAAIVFSRDRFTSNTMLRFAWFAGVAGALYGAVAGSLLIASLLFSAGTLNLIAALPFLISPAVVFGAGAWLMVTGSERLFGGYAVLLFGLSLLVHPTIDWPPLPATGLFLLSAAINRFAPVSANRV